MITESGIMTGSIDVMTLINTILTLITAMLGMITAVYAISSAARSKRAEEVATDNAVLMKEVAVNTNSMTTTIAALSVKEGQRDGLERGARIANGLAEALARGQQEGRDQAMVASGPPPAAGEKPLPVADDRTADAAEKSAAALEKSADATARVATAAEESKDKPKKE